MSERLRVWILPSHIGFRTKEVTSLAVEPFIQKHPGLTIEWRLTSWSQIWSDLMLSFKNGDPPDILEIGTTWLSTLSHLGYLAPVPEGLEQTPVMAPWISQSVTYNDQQTGIVRSLDCSCIIARSDVLDSMGVQPAQLNTWESFAHTCQRIGELTKKTGHDPMHPYPLGLICRPEPTTFHNVAPWLFSGGWNIPNLSKKPVSMLSSASAQPGLKFLDDLLRTSQTPEDVGEIQPYRLNHDFYQEGRFAFLTANWWLMALKLLGHMPEEFDRWPITLLPTPSGPAGAIPRAGGLSLAVSTQSKMQELAWELVQYLISEEFMGEWSWETGCVPAHGGAFWERVCERPEGILMRDIVTASQFYPVHPLWRSMEFIMAKGVSDMLWGFLHDRRYGKETKMLAVTVDEQLNSLLEMAWEGRL